MPSFHIECKATASKKLPLSILKKWYAQLEKDCPDDKVAVLFHFANGVSPVVIMPFNSYLDLRTILAPLTMLTTTGSCFNPTQHMLINKAAGQRLADKLSIDYKHIPCVIFEIASDKFFFTFDAEYFLEKMLRFQGQKVTSLPSAA